MSDEKRVGSAATVEKVFILIEAMAKAKGPSGVTQLSRQLGFNKTTVHRLLETLRRNGYVRQDEDRSLYVLTPKLWELGIGVVEETSLYAVATAYLDAAAEETGESVSLAIPLGDHALIVNRVASKHTLQAVAPVGTRAPLHASAIGKASMVDWSDQRIRRQANALTAITDRTITSGDGLVAAVAEARRRGYSVVVDEWRVGVSAVSAPVRDCAGNIVGVISIAGPTSRLYPDRIEPYGRKVAEVAGEVSFELGHRAHRFEDVPQ